MNVPKISQSLMKNYVDYLNEKECGLFFKANYIDKDPDAQKEPTDAMKIGIFFEYLCTGALPRSGETPTPDMVYKGKANEKLSAPYERAVESAETFKHIIECRLRNTCTATIKPGIAPRNCHSTNLPDVTGLVCRTAIKVRVARYTTLNTRKP